MAHQNITLSLPTRVLRQVKLLAAKRHTSVSRLLTQVLEELASREAGYARARRRHLTWLESAANLGTVGRIRWTRDELHER